MANDYADQNDSIILMLTLDQSKCTYIKYRTKLHHSNDISGLVEAMRQDNNIMGLTRKQEKTTLTLD